MKIRDSLLLLTASLATFMLSSCVVPTTEYGGRYYDPGYDSNDFYYYNGGPYPNYYNRGYGGYVAGYSYYRGSNVCPICHHNPCSGHRGHESSSHAEHHDHNDYQSNNHWNSNHSSDSTQYERASGAPGKADGIHSKEWFLSRGYSPRQIEKSDGQINSSRKNDHDDDDKKKKHHDDSEKKKEH